MASLRCPRVTAGRSLLTESNGSPPLARYGGARAKGERSNLIAYSLCDRVAVARVRGAFCGADLLAVEPPGVPALIAGPCPCAALLFDVRTVTQLGVPFFERLQSGRRTTALVLYSPGDRSAARMAFSLGRSGVDAVCVQGEDDSPGELRDHVEAARSHLAITSLREMLTALVPAFDAAAWATVLAHVSDLRTAAEMAAVLGLSRQRLHTTLRRAGLPAPRRFLAWCRLLRASVLLEDSSRTTESVGLAVNYASGPAFRNACQYLVGVRPSEIREHGGAAFVLQRLGTQIRKGKHAPPSEGPELPAQSHRTVVRSNHHWAGNELALVTSDEYRNRTARVHFQIDAPLGADIEHDVLSGC